MFKFKTNTKNKLYVFFVHLIPGEGGEEAAELDLVGVDVVEVVVEGHSVRTGVRTVLSTEV